MRSAWSSAGNEIDGAGVQIRGAAEAIRKRDHRDALISILTAVAYFEDALKYVAEWAAVDWKPPKQFSDIRDMMRDLRDSGSFMVAIDNADRYSTVEKKAMDQAWKYLLDVTAAQSRFNQWLDGWDEGVTSASAKAADAAVNAVGGAVRSLVSAADEVAKSVGYKWPDAAKAASAAAKTAQLAGDLGGKILAASRKDEGLAESDEMLPEVQSFLDYLGEIVIQAMDDAGVSPDEADDAFDIAFDIAAKMAEDGVLPVMPDIDNATADELAAWVTEAEGVGFRNVVASFFQDAMNDDDDDDGNDAVADVVEGKGSGARRSGKKPGPYERKRKGSDAAALDKWEKRHVMPADAGIRKQIKRQGAKSVRKAAKDEIDARLRDEVRTEPGGLVVTEAKAATLFVWDALLASKLTQYDRRMSAKDGNIYRLGHLLGAAQKVRDAVSRDLDKDDPESIEKFRAAMLSHFSPTFAPVRAVEKQIDEYLKSGKLPKLA